MTYITISDNAEVGHTDDRNTEDALLVLTPEQARVLLANLLNEMTQAGML